MFETDGSEDSVSWFALKLCRGQIALINAERRFALRAESIEHDANEKLSTGTKGGDVSRFFAEHSIPLQIGESEAWNAVHFRMWPPWLRHRFGFNRPTSET